MFMKRNSYAGITKKEYEKDLKYVSIVIDSDFH